MLAQRTKAYALRSLESATKSAGGFRTFGALFRRSFSTEDKLEQRKKKLIYRCKQRGILELDLLLGSWAEKNLSGMDEDQFVKFEKIAAEENPDLLQWLVYRTATVPAEKGLDSNLMQSLLSYTHEEKKLWVKDVESGNQ